MAAGRTLISFCCISTHGSAEAFRRPRSSYVWAPPALRGSLQLLLHYRGRGGLMHVTKGTCSSSKRSCRPLSWAPMQQGEVLGLCYCLDPPEGYKHLNLSECEDVMSLCLRCSPTSLCESCFIASAIEAAAVKLHFSCFYCEKMRTLHVNAKAYLFV